MQPPGLPSHTSGALLPDGLKILQNIPEHCWPCCTNPLHTHSSLFFGPSTSYQQLIHPSCRHPTHMIKIHINSTGHGPCVRACYHPSSPGACAKTQPASAHPIHSSAYLCSSSASSRAAARAQAGPLDGLDDLLHVRPRAPRLDTMLLYLQTRYISSGSHLSPICSPCALH